MPIDSVLCESPLHATRAVVTQIQPRARFACNHPHRHLPPWRTVVVREAEPAAQFVARMTACRHQIHQKTQESAPELLGTVLAIYISSIETVGNHMRKKLVLVGNGMAGMRAIEELLKLAPDMYDIVVFGTEPYGNYNRILLSPLLAGEKTLDDIMLNTVPWYAEHGITLHSGQTVTKIDRTRRIVYTDEGTSASYDVLILATGSNPVVIPIPGADLDGVATYRDVEDVNKMLAISKTRKNAVVIGGGLLGLEAAYGLQKQGMDVTVVHLLDSLMERQLDKPAAALLRSSLEKRGLRFEMEAKTEAIVGTDRAEAVRFADNFEIPADLVVMAIGIRPNIELADSAGVYCERGIVVNDTMQTFDPRIYSVGECAQHRGQCYGLVAPLFEQAKILANHVAELGFSRYEGSMVSTKLKVTGIDVFSAGDIVGDEDTEAVLFQDPAKSSYKKLLLKNQKIVGAVLYGDTTDGTRFFQMIRDRIDVSDIRDTLLFGHNSVGDSGTAGVNTTTTLPDSTEICGCNGVCKGTIVDAIVAQNLFTLDDVRQHTKASSSCGSCTGLVEQLLADTLGGNYSASPAKKSVCRCTDFSHDEVRRVIREQSLKTIPKVMTFLDWKAPDGCPKCRPALNFYLLCEWPGEYEDDQQSRFINERAHANIQKDGSYSVIPRIWGGITSPAELKAIAEVAEKYQVPTVKFTGGQRLDLLGVKKDDLPGMWSDLNEAGFVSGHAYGKALRTVKTCVGSDWCRFGTQDSTGLGIKLERMAWGSWSPHKVKLAVSGCPRNCSEATIKDMGIVCVDSGYELHVGGNGGIKIRPTDFLCKVETEDDVLEYCGAFLQLYREDGHYLERTAAWIERVGLSSVKEVVVEDEARRQALHGRFLHSQTFSQTDPWAENAQGERAMAFRSIDAIRADKQSHVMQEADV